MVAYLHPLFIKWLHSLGERGEKDGVDWPEVQGEIAALVTALEERGRGLGDPECHPVVTSPYDLHALRRTPPSDTVPYAEGPPVIRVLFGYVSDVHGSDAAVVLIGGDKTELGNLWYPANVQLAQDRLEQWCRRSLEYYPLRRRTR